MNTSPSLNGEVTTDGQFARIYFQRRLKHSPERVWAALTDPEEYGQWFMASSVKIDGRVGGSMETVAGPSQFAAHGKILTWDPPHVFEYEWIVAPRKELPEGENSIVRWELKPDGQGTLLTLAHRKLTPRTAQGFAPGLHAFLDRLEALLDKRPLPDWMKRYGEVQGAYRAWA